MNRTRLVAVVLIVGVLAVIGVLGVWQRSEASDPQLGDAVTVKSTPSPSTPADTTWPILPPRGWGVIAAAWQGIERIRAAWHLPYSFLRHCGLSVS
jgi:hypothetical protein